MGIKVRLTRKFAERLNGVDLSHVRPGEEIDLLPQEAEILIAEGWAVPADQPPEAEDRSRRRRRRRPAES